jgi:hypothetical protein
MRAVAIARLPDVTTAQLPAGLESSSRRTPRYRRHVGGVVELLLPQVSGRLVDISGCAYQFGNEVGDSPSVLDIAVEIEARHPALRPEVPGCRRSAVGIDQDTVAVQQQPVDLEAHCVGVDHEDSLAHAPRVVTLLGRSV